LKGTHICGGNQRPSSAQNSKATMARNVIADNLVKLITPSGHKHIPHMWDGWLNK